MKFVLQSVVCVVALVALSDPLAAQTSRPGRPYRGLFGGGVGDAEQLLAVNLSVGGGYDDNVLAGDSQGVGVTRVSKAGHFGSVSGDVSYSFNTERMTASLGAATDVRYRPTVPSDEFQGTFGGGADISFELWSGGRLTASQSVGYQPYYTLTLFPVLGADPLAQPVIGDPDLAAIAAPYWSYGTGVGLSQQVSRRGSLGFSFQRQVSDFSGDSADFSSWGGAGRYSHSVARGLGLRLGYGYREMDNDSLNSGRSRVHSIDAGVDFNRALSISRRTSLSFGTGTSAVADAEGTRYHLTGGAQLTREIARTWNAAVGYHRGVQFIDALGDTTLTDGVALTVGGMISRRLDFRSGAAVSFGHPAGQSGGSDFDSYMATTGLRYAITRYAAVGVDYSYYRYEFPRDAVVPAAFGQKSDRQSIHAYLALWAPLVHRARRTDAAR